MIFQADVSADNVVLPEADVVLSKDTLNHMDVLLAAKGLRSFCCAARGGRLLLNSHRGAPFRARSDRYGTSWSKHDYEAGDFVSFPLRAMDSWQDSTGGDGGFVKYERVVLFEVLPSLEDGDEFGILRGQTVCCALYEPNALCLCVFVSLSDASCL